VKATYEGRVPEGGLYALFAAIAELFGRAERALFADRHVRGKALAECKREYLRRFGLTARQFNAVETQVRGKVEAAREGSGVRLIHLREAAASAERAIKKAERDLRRPKGAAARGDSADPGVAEKRRRLRFKLHQKKRRLASLESRLKALEDDRRAGRVRICFGGKRLFHAQFHLQENGYSCFEEWRADFQRARSGQFLCLGSKDETSGNQTCTRMPDGSLRLRVPPALEEQYGSHVRIEGIRFRYGQREIDAALERGEAITYRILRRERKGKDVWYIQITVERPDAHIVTDPRLGALGIDLNPSHVDVGEIDRFGNVTGTRSFPVDLQKRTRAQVTATLCEVVADIVDWARQSGKPIAVEELDFQKKKAALREQSPRYARMLSTFAYQKFFALLRSRAAREGVEVIDEDHDGEPGVNPAFTSVIGEAKFAPGYGLSPHCAAAVAIARRGLRFGERLRSRSAFPLPARTRGKHVWRDWRRVAQRLRAERARGRRSFEEGRGRGIPLSSAAPARGSPDIGPPCDGLAAAPGCEPPAQIVGTAVRPAS